MQSLRSKVVVVALVVLGVTLFLGRVEYRSAEARSPDKVFRGQIITSAKAISTRAKSASAMIKRLKKAKTTKFKEDPETQTWKIYYAAFFRTPLKAVEVTVKLYDLSGGRRTLITSFEQYTDGAGQTSLFSHIKLEREYVGVNKKVMMVIESRNTPLAQGTFHILGKAEVLSGEADFTKE